MCACVSVGGCVRVTVQERDRKSEREREREESKLSPEFPRNSSSVMVHRDGLSRAGEPLPRFRLDRESGERQIGAARESIIGSRQSRIGTKEHVSTRARER